MNQCIYNRLQRGNDFSNYIRQPKSLPACMTPSTLVLEAEVVSRLCNEIMFEIFLGDPYMGARTLCPPLVKSTTNIHG